MTLFSLRVLPAVICAALMIGPALGQTGSPKVEDQQKQASKPTDQAEERQRRLDEFAEAQRLIQSDAGQPECVWVGRRVVSLLWRDDLDTALRHLQMYDRFRCPDSHVQMAFRCLVRNGNIDPRVPESLPNQIHACWIDPSLRPSAVASPADAPQKR